MKAPSRFSIGRWLGVIFALLAFAPAADLLHGWKLAAPPAFPQPDPIDATLIKIGETFFAYYRVAKGGGIQLSTSPDLAQWRHLGKLTGTRAYLELANLIVREVVFARPPDLGDDANRRPLNLPTTAERLNNKG